MLRLFAYVAVSVFAALAGAGAAVAEPSFSKADALFQLVRDDGNVCCWRGGQVWWTNWNSCRNAGGQATANETCRNAGNNGYGGYGNYSQYDDPYANPDRRVCCSSSYGVGWASWRQCRYARGQEVMNKVCRKTKYGFDYNTIGRGYRDDDSSAYWNQRVCCSDGYRATWSTLGECRRIRGEQVMNKVCRN